MRSLNHAELNRTSQNEKPTTSDVISLDLTRPNFAAANSAAQPMKFDLPACDIITQRHIAQMRMRVVPAEVEAGKDESLRPTSSEGSVT